MRVFAKGTKPGLFKTLQALPVDELPKVVKQGGFNKWYEEQLEKIASEIGVLNSDNLRILPGLKWGHAAKVLSLFLRDLVEYSRYFSDHDAKAIARALHVPIDSIVIARLKTLRVKAPCRQIKDIDTRESFYKFQNIIEAAAKAVDVPRTWFDDNWADRQ